MFAKQEPYGNKLLPHTHLTCRAPCSRESDAARWSNTTVFRSKRTLRKPASINGSKNCKRYLPDTSSDIRTGQISLTTRAGEINYYMVMHWCIALGVHFASKAATSSWGLWVGQRWQLELGRWSDPLVFPLPHNVGAATSSWNTGSVSETYRWS